MKVDVDLGPVTVLIIDDSRYARSFIKSALQSFGIRSILEAGDGPAGIEILREKKVHVVIVDYEMTPMDGVTFTTFVRTGDALSCVEVPIIMVSSLADMDRVMAARNAGVNEFLVKPLSNESLFRRLRNVLVNPRAFVATAVYVGPDRRTAERKPPQGEERRSAPPLPKPPPIVQPLPGRHGPSHAGTPVAVKPPAPAAERTGKKRFCAGTVIFDEGHHGDEAYVVESGKVAIYKTTDGQRVVLGTLGPNGVFGEMALIDDEPRMASAMAEEDTVCLVIPKTALRSQIGKTPELVILVLETLLHDIRKLGRELVQVRAVLERRSA
jgi:CheY-like chemotaxis protein